MSLSQLPMQVHLTRVIPENVEAAMTAVVTGAFVFSYDVGCKLSGSYLCQIFEVDNNHLDRYWVVLLIKLPLIIVTMFLTWIIPSNEQIEALALR